MKRALAFGLVHSLAAASGCRSEAENVIRQTISDMDALSDAIERKESPEKIRAAAERLRATAARARDVQFKGSEKDRLKSATRSR